MQIRYAFFVDVFFANVWLLKNYGFSFLVYFMRQSSKPLSHFDFRVLCLHCLTDRWILMLICEHRLFVILLTSINMCETNHVDAFIHVAFEVLENFSGS